MSQKNRKKTRKFLVQKLYARIYGEVNTERFYESYYEWILDFDTDMNYLDEMFDHIITHQDDIISIIKSYAPKFDIETMIKTNIIVMAICIAELLYLKEEIPGKVSLNEAIELSKYFWDDSCKKIVNGILNNFLSNIDTHLKSSKISTEKFNFFV